MSPWARYTVALVAIAHRSTRAPDASSCQSIAGVLALEEEPAAGE